MKLSDNEINNMLNKKDFISPFLHNTDIRGFIQDIKKYLSINCADPKGEAKDYIKSVIIKNGIDNPDAFLKKYIFINISYSKYAHAYICNFNKYNRHCLNLNKTPKNQENI